jgi:hypothetical protein
VGNTLQAGIFMHVKGKNQRATEICEILAALSVAIDHILLLSNHSLFSKTYIK